MNEPPVQPYCPSSLRIAEIPWVFTQRAPLSAENFGKESEKRGLKLDLDLLREFYKYGLIEPMFYVGTRKGTPIDIAADEPRNINTLPFEYRQGRAHGKLQDLGQAPFRPRLRFKKSMSDPGRWWNGLIYSHYQLLALSYFKQVEKLVYYRRRNGRVLSSLRNPNYDQTHSRKFRGIALALTALEARYLPNLEREWVQLSNTEHGEWERYRAAFNPEEVALAIGYSAEQARLDAEFLLLRAHAIDPLDQNWQKLVRRTPRDKWRTLKGDALLAMDLREAAEILLRFYEDLADRGVVESLPDMSAGHFWHPLLDRLSNRPESLDQDLTRLGLSPHPRVILAIEGETERVHIPLIWGALGYPESPELVRTLKLGGVDRDLQKIAALAVAPLMGEPSPDGKYWTLIKPPAKLLIAVDPEGRQFGTPEKVAKTRASILEEIRDVVRAQGASVAEKDLNELVEIQTWSASCYEFEHFSDEQLAAALQAVHQTCNGLDFNALSRKVGQVRSKRKDIKEVWSDWDYRPSKVALAHALWPVLAFKIDRLRGGAKDLDVPHIVATVEQAYVVALNRRYGTYLLNASQPVEDL